MEKISIIMPIYNGERYLESAINSIFNSTYENIELILVDDGSTDKSEEICLTWAKKNERIKVVKQKNQGVASARNTGIQNASGDWIGFCDQDDIVNVDMYSKMIERVSNDKSDMAICGTGKLVKGQVVEVEKFPDIVLENREVVEKLLYSIMFKCYKYKNKFSDINLENWIWKCIVKKELIHKYNINFKKFINFEDDRTFLMELLTVAQRVSLLSECLYYWRVNLKSETYRRKYVDNIEYKIEIYNRYQKKILNRAIKSNELVKKYFSCEKCNDYVLMIENEYSISNNKKFIEKIVYLKKNIYDAEFKINIKERKNLNKFMIKRRVILALLDYHCLILSYLFCVIYTWIKTKMMRFRISSLMESRIRGK